MSDTKKKISVVTCAYNEEDCISELGRRLLRVADALPAYDFEILAIDNGSEDSTLEEMRKVRQRDARFKIVELSRNFGLDGGFAAGLDVADGDAVVLMAADLQDPPEVIPEFVAAWEAGYRNVYGLVANRGGTGLLRRANSRLFYWLMGKLSDSPAPKHARDFRLIDRKVYEQVRSIEDAHPLHRGLAAWTGFESIGIEFDQPPRFGGTTKANSTAMVEFALRSIFSQSMTPIRVMPVCGLVLVAGSFLALLGISINSLVNGVPFPGFGSVVALVILLFGVLFLFLSVIGIYVGLIFEQVRKRPLYVVDVLWGVESPMGKPKISPTETRETTTLPPESEAGHRSIGKG
jgi:glycosyltransferase involved in cell wall biosynthesis